MGNVTSENELGKAQYLLKIRELFINTNINKIILTMVSKGIISFVNNYQSQLPATVENSVLVNAAGEDKTVVQIIRFNVGLRSSKSVLNAEDQFGFNQKSFDFLNRNFYVVVQDYAKISKINS
jgi:hypothetical protein